MTIKPVLCVLVLGILAQGIQGQRPGGRDRRPGRPRPEACDPDSIGDVPEATKTLLAGVLANTTDPVELLPLLGELPSVCLRLLRENFAEYEGSCEQADVVTTLCANCGPDAESPCESRRAGELLHTAMACLDPDTKCAFLNEMLNLETQCVPVEVTGELAKMSLAEGCSVDNLPVCSILSLPLGDLEQHLTGLDADKLLELLGEIDPSFIAEALSCEKVQVIARVVQQKGLFDFEQNAAAILANMDQYLRLLPLLPFLPKEICASIPAEVLNTLKDHLVQVDFMCSNKEERGRGRHSMGGADQERGSKPGAEASSASEDAGMCGLGDKDDSHMRQVGRQNDNNRRCQFHCGMAIVKTLVDDGLDISNVTVREGLGHLGKCLPPGQLKDAARPGECGDFGADKVPSRSMGGKAIAKKCRPDKSPDTWTDEDIESMGCTFTELGRSDLQRIPKEQLCAALQGDEGDLSECMKEQHDRPADFDRVVARKCAGDELGPDKVRNLGGGAVKAPCATWAAMDSSERETIAEEMAEGIEEMVDNKQRGARGKASCIKVTDLPMKKLAGSRAMTDNLPLKDFKTKAGTDKNAFRQALGIDEGVRPDLPRRQNQKGFDIMKGTKACEDLTQEDLESMSTLVRGIRSSCIKKLNEAQRLEILQDLCAFGEWGQKQAVALGDALNQALADFNPENPMEEVTPALVEDLDTNCLVGLGGRLVNMSTDACVDVCDRLGSASGLECVMNPRMRTRIAGICVDCMGAADRALTEEEVMKLGQLLPHVAAEVLDKVTGQILKNNGKMFSNLRCIKKDVIDTIQGKINAAVSAADDADSLAELGAWAAGLPTDKIQLVKDVLADLAGSITAGLQRDPESAHCCTRSMAETDNTLIQTEVKARLAAISQLVQDTAEPVAARRKRRETTALTCVSMTTMGSAVTQLTVEDIAALTEVEFVDCLQTLGNQEGWSTEQITELIKKIKEFVAADVCAMTSDDLQTLGSIAYGLTIAEVDCLEGLDIDALGNLGDLDNWPQEHKAAFATRYLARHNHSSPSSLTSADVIAMGNFLCGLTPEQIALITPSVYGESSAAIGRLESCPYGQLVALATHAKHADNLGPVSGWTAAEFGEAGIVAAGLTVDELKSVSEDKIEGWTRHAVMAMRTADIAALSVEQLGTFSVDQAYSVDYSGGSFTEEQKNALMVARASFDGVDAGEEGDGGDGGDDTSGVTHVETSVAAILVLLSCLFV